MLTKWSDSGREGQRKGGTDHCLVCFTSMFSIFLTVWNNSVRERARSFNCPKPSILIDINDKGHPCEKSLRFPFAMYVKEQCLTLIVYYISLLFCSKVLENCYESLSMSVFFLLQIEMASRIWCVWIAWRVCQNCSWNRKSLRAWLSWCQW